MCGCSGGSGCRFRYTLWLVYSVGIAAVFEYGFRSKARQARQELWRVEAVDVDEKKGLLRYKEGNEHIMRVDQ
jgi:hypothetical protein